MKSVIVKSLCNLGKPWFEALGCSVEVTWGRVGGALQEAGGGAPGGGPPLPPGQHQPRPGAQLPAEVESSLRLGVEAVALGNILHIQQSLLYEANAVCEQISPTECHFS